MRILLVFFFFLITSAYALAQNTIEFSYTLKHTKLIHQLLMLRR